MVNEFGLSRKRVAITPVRLKRYGSLHSLTHSRHQKAEA